MTARAEQPHVLLVTYDGEADHFAGVEAALVARGISTARYTLRHVAEPFPASARVVVVKDIRTYLSLFALRQARRQGATAVLVMDGIVEYRNTYLNPRAGADFLRPAPVDVIACAGEVDRRLLEGFGNNAVATGLPRLAATFPAPLPPVSGGPVLIATANQPCFTPRERARLLRSLTRLRATLEDRGIPAIWRLTAGLDVELGVAPVPGPPTPLREALAAAAAVITTPSTVLVESMLAGRPTALLHPHPVPCWQPAVWVWRGGEVPAAATGDGLDPASIPIADPAELVRRLLAPDAAERARHSAAIAQLHHGERPAADAVADLIAGAIERPCRARHPIPLPRVERVPPALPAGPRPRIVACLRLDGTTVGDLLMRTQRLASAFAARADAAGEEGEQGFDVRTLAIITQPDSWDPAASPLAADPLTHVCVVDPLADPWRQIETVRSALERLAPAAVLAQADELCLMAAELLRPGGARVAVMVDGDDDQTRTLLGHFNRWDGAVAGSSSAHAWLSDEAAGRPVALLGPIVSAPEREAASPASGTALAPPLRLAHIGPMLDPAARLFQLHALLDHLERAAVPHELHMIGDGDHLAAWHAAARAALGRWGSVTAHGRRDAAWLREFLPTVDIAVHLGEAEGVGTSILDAMAAGAFPVVADVPPTLRSTLRDGENAIIVPLDDPGAAAARIAALARDRARLATLSHAAWWTAQSLPDAVSITAAAAGLFAALLARPAQSGRADLGLRRSLVGRWTRPWTEDAAGAEQWIRDRLAAAGARSIALDRPAPGSDAVIIRPHEQRIDPRLVAAWRSRGIAVVAAPDLRADFHPLALRMHALLAEAAAAGCSRLAIFGAGAHTRRASDLVRFGLPIVGVIDDAAAHEDGGGTLFGVPVVSFRDAPLRLRPDAVLLSSDAHEEQMWERCAPLRAVGVRIIRLYGAGEPTRAAARTTTREPDCSMPTTEVAKP